MKWVKLEVPGVVPGFAMAKAGIVVVPEVPMGPRTVTVLVTPRAAELLEEWRDGTTVIGDHVAFLALLGSELAR